MSLIHQMIQEVVRCRETRGNPVCIQVNPMTKHALESEMRMRASFNNANAFKNADKMIINRLHEIDDRGRPVPGGWEIPIESVEKVPVGQFWVGVDGYEISETQLGRKIPLSFLKFPGRY
jgi:hypothetical protein